MVHRKTAYALDIASALDLPELCDRNSGDAAGDDLSIDLAAVPEPGEWDARQLGPLIWAAPTALMFEVPGVARYWIGEGRRIVVEPDAAADVESVRLFLLGSAFGALLLQRGCLVLHGCAVEIDGAACVAVGRSGIGKSTLAEGLRRRGCTVLADDVVAIDSTGMALPGIPRIKLWRDVVDRLAIDPTHLSRIRPNLEKFHVPVDGGDPIGRRPVRWIYALGAHHADDVAIAPATGPDAFALLRDNGYRRRFDEALASKSDHLVRAMRVAGAARMATVRRPLSGFALDALIDAILADVRR